MNIKLTINFFYKFYSSRTSYDVNEIKIVSKLVCYFFALVVLLLVISFDFVILTDIHG